MGKSLLGQLEGAVGLGIVAIGALLAYKYREEIGRVLKGFTNPTDPDGLVMETGNAIHTTVDTISYTIRKFLIDLGIGVQTVTDPVIDGAVDTVTQPIQIVQEGYNDLQAIIDSLLGGGSTDTGYTGPTQTPEQAGLAPFTPPTDPVNEGVWSLATGQAQQPEVLTNVDWTPGSDPANDAATLPANGTLVDVGGNSQNNAIAWNGGLIDPSTGGYFTGYGPEVAGPQYPGSPGALLAVGPAPAPEPVAPTVYYDPDLTAISNAPLESDWVAAPATAPIVQALVYAPPPAPVYTPPAPVYVPPPAPVYTAPAQQTQTYIRMGGAHQVI